MHARNLFAIGTVVALAAWAIVASWAEPPVKVTSPTPVPAPTATVKPSNTPYPATFADGPARGIAERSCLACHSAMLVTQQRKDSLGWEKSVRQMETWGAPVAPEQHKPLVDYLIRNYSPARSK